ncbi:MAG TPA: histidine kinase [Mizugakiibacter sp.]
MNTERTARAPSFVPVLLGGWALLIIGIAAGTLPMWSDRSFVVWRAAYTVCCILASLLVVAICRELWRRGASLRVAAAVVMPVTLLLGFLCSATALYVEVQVNHIWPPAATDGAGRPLTEFHWSVAMPAVASGWFTVLLWAVLYYSFRHLVALRDERQRALEAAALARDAELRALRYQLNPHFLFNTLNAISTLVLRREARDATRMIARLGDLLRATLEGEGGHEVALADELALTEQYLEIEKIRFGERLRVQLEIAPGTLQARVPHLLLQPFVENAIRHGIAPRSEGGTLLLRTQRDRDRLRLGISDDGLGRMALHARLLDGEHHGIGIDNARARLDRMYGGDYRLQIDYPAAGGCVVEIELPFCTEDEAVLRRAS